MLTVSNASGVQRRGQRAPQGYDSSIFMFSAFEHLMVLCLHQLLQHGEFSARKWRSIGAPCTMLAFEVAERTPKGTIDGMG
jgi:hypothetical protein